MREFLFRGKTKEGKWIESDSILRIENIGVKLWDRDDGWVEIISNTVGQFTGLTDKNGIKIFEGDIVKACWNTKFKVYFDEQILQYRAKAHHEPHREISYYGYSYQMEVIGNIYNNPELWGV